MKFINSVLLAAGLAGITACATVNQPEGGPRDTTPPTLVNATPENQQLNVRTNTIRLEFDENVQQNNLQRELLVTPFTDNKYRVKLDGNVMELVFEKPLQDSTTYIFNFRDGIQDITEKNTLKGFRLSFSTGSYIDSSRVSGNVIDLLTQQAEKEVTVALYPADDTTNIRKSRPYYQTQTDANGQFRFENIREGNYKIFALQDKNKNNLYDNENEKIAFLAKPITIRPDTQQVVLQTFLIDTKKPIAMQRQKYADRFTVTYNESVENIKAIIATQKDSVLIKRLPDGKTVELFKSQKFSGGKTIVSAVDSAGNMALDTIQVDFGQDYTPRIQGAAIKVTNMGNGSKTYRQGQRITIEMQGQVTITGASPITIQSDTTLSIQLKYPEQVTLDRTQTELSFVIPKLTPRTRPYSIVLDSTQVKPVMAKRIPMPPIPLTIGEGQGTGSLKGTVTLQARSFKVQLLDSKFKVVAETSNTRNFNFRNVEPGIYNIRVLVDENNNGKWERGRATFDREPERVYLYPNEVEVRANWEIEDIKIQL